MRARILGSFLPSPRSPSHCPPPPLPPFPYSQSGVDRSIGVDRWWPLLSSPSPPAIPHLRFLSSPLLLELSLASPQGQTGILSRGVKSGQGEITRGSSRTEGIRAGRGSTGDMSGEDVRKLSRQDIQLVQNLIERCLQLYMNQKEVVDTLSDQAKIEPSFTELVWQKLEEENREFFKAYYLRLMLKNQIMAFNKLLEDQYRLMNKVYPSRVPFVSLPSGSNSNPSKQNSCFLPESAPISALPNDVMRNGGSSGVVNGTPSSDQLIYAGKDIHGLHSGMDASTGLLSAQNASAVLFGADNGTTIKTESGYSSNDDFAFCGNAFLESCQSIGDASGGSFSSSELNGQPLNDSVLDIESSSFGFLSQIPRNFSFSDLTEDFSQSAG